LLSDAKARHPIEVLGFCLIPNHFHLVLEAAHEKSLSEFMQWLLTNHVRRYRNVGGWSHNKAGAWNT
jgi:putative transposase